MRAENHCCKYKAAALAILPDISAASEQQRPEWSWRVVARCNDPVRMELFEELGLATICPSLLGARALYGALMDETLHQRDIAGAIERLLVER